MAEQNSADFETGDRKLSDIFDEALSHYEEILKSNELSSSLTFQTKLKKTVKLFEESTQLINLAGVFSSNEEFSEIATSDIKYLLIPACLGDLVTRVQSQDRSAALETAEVYYRDFLKRLVDYEVISNVHIKDLQGQNDEEEKAPPKKLDLEQMARERNEKIRKYREQKEMEAELTRLRSLLINYDEDVTRKYYETYLKSQASIVVDELKSIKQELPLAKMAEQKSGNQVVAGRGGDEKPRPPPLRPIIITKNEIQKKVFGAGYPSLPTYTVDEFYQQRVADGIFPAHGSTYNKTLQDLADPEISKAEEELADTQKEREVEEDDPEALARARDFDEYKDEHKRGWGNRANRS